MAKRKSKLENVEKSGHNLVEVTIPMPDMKFQVLAESLLDSAKKIRIETPKQYEDAANTLKRLTVAETQVEEARVEQKKPINLAATKIQNIFKPSLNFLEEAKEIIRKEMGRYFAAQEAKRLEDQRQAEEDAETERQQLLELASKTRKTSAKTGLMTQARNVTVDYTPVEAPKVEGITMREYWEWEIEDESLVPRQFLMIDEVAVNALVRAKKGETKIAGIKVKMTNKPAVGSR